MENLQMEESLVVSIEEVKDVTPKFEAGDEGNQGKRTGPPAAMLVVKHKNKL